MSFLPQHIVNRILQILCISILHVPRADNIHLPYKLQDPRIKRSADAYRHGYIEGFLSDEDLEKLYRSCRMAIVPLRYGAGVKGKVVESAYYQIPLVTTSIGAEGIDTTMGNMVIHDNAKEMAESICSLYYDFDALKKMSDCGAELIHKHYTLEEAERVLRQDVEC